jgi:hypothetical protein
MLLKHQYIRTQGGFTKADELDIEWDCEAYNVPCSTDGYTSHVTIKVSGSPLRSFTLLCNVCSMSSLPCTGAGLAGVIWPASDFVCHFLCMRWELISL